MRLKNMVVVAALLGLHLPTPPLGAEDQAELNRTLLRKIEELQQQVRILQRQDELAKESSAEKAKTAANVSIGAGGFNVQSGDSNFVLKVRGYAQADARFYFDDISPRNDTFLLRRVRPIFEGTVFNKYDYRIMLDFPSSVTTSAGNNGFVQDAYLNARFFPAFQIQVGKFKEPVGLERLQSGGNLLFVERSYPTQLVPNRDVGIQIHGIFLDDVIAYQAGVFNGISDGGSTDFDANDDEKDLAGRIFAHPFKKTSISGLKGLGLGLSGTVGNHEGTLRGYTSPGQQNIFSYLPSVSADGDYWRLSPQFYYYWGPLGIFGEYVFSNAELRRTGSINTIQAQHEGWQLAASYFLTGEDNSFKAVNPKKPFNIGDGGWGAWEISGRVSQINFDSSVFPNFANPATSARRATSWALGLNWHLNRNVKMNLNYENTDFDGGSGSPLLNTGEQILFSRVQFSF